MPVGALTRLLRRLPRNGPALAAEKLTPEQLEELTRAAASATDGKQQVIFHGQQLYSDMPDLGPWATPEGRWYASPEAAHAQMFARRYEDEPRGALHVLGVPQRSLTTVVSPLVPSNYGVRGWSGMDPGDLGRGMIGDPEMRGATMAELLGLPLRKRSTRGIRWAFPLGDRYPEYELGDRIPLIRYARGGSARGRRC